MKYIDGFVVAVPRANKDDYIKLATDASALFKEFGATRVVECWEDNVPDGNVTDFRRAVNAKEDEMIVFSWIEYPSKEIRDAAQEKMISDPRMGEMQMPFDMSRMIYGGFAPILDE